ncbi:MAG: hypothetical protein Q4G33_05260 [bacterium]|nr:hypothetical protein [bacterium]
MSFQVYNPNSFYQCVWEKRSKQIAVRSDVDVCLYFKSLRVARCGAYLYSLPVWEKRSKQVAALRGAVVLNVLQAPKGGKM